MWDPNTRIFEYREYTPTPGKLRNLAARFENYTQHTYRRVGTDPVGFFFEDIPNHGNFVDILGFENSKAWEPSRVAHTKDPVFHEVYERTMREEAPPWGDLYFGIKNRFLKPMPFSPFQ